MSNKFIPSFQSQTLAVFVLFIVFDGLYVTDQLIPYLMPVRYILFCVLGFGLLSFCWFLYKTKKIKKSHLTVTYFHLILLAYGLVFSSLNDGLLLASFRVYSFAFLAVFLTLFVMVEATKNEAYAEQNRTNQQSSLSKRRKINFNTFFLCLLILTPIAFYFLNILELSPTPRLNFDLEGSPRYLQSTSKLFGIGAIVFFHLAFSKSRWISAIYFLFAIILTFMSGLGGARGEFLVTLIILFLVSARNFRNRKTILLTFLLFGAGVGGWLYFGDRLNNLLIYERLSAVGLGDFGLRDVFFMQSMSLMDNKMECVLVGCGFNYFQVYYGHDYGGYPHNIFVELLITYGALAGGLIILLTCIGVAFGFLGPHNRTPVYWVLLYFLGISLKSGSLLDLTSIPSLVFFVYLALLASNRVYVKNSMQMMRVNT